MIKIYKNKKTWKHMKRSEMMCGNWAMNYGVSQSQRCKASDLVPRCHSDRTASDQPPSSLPHWRKAIDHGNLKNNEEGHTSGNTLWQSLTHISVVGLRQVRRAKWNHSCHAKGLQNPFEPQVGDFLVSDASDCRPASANPACTPLPSRIAMTCTSMGRSQLCTSRSLMLYS